MDSYWYQISFGRGRDIHLFERYDITMDKWYDLYDWYDKITEVLFSGIRIWRSLFNLIFHRDGRESVYQCQTPDMILWDRREEWGDLNISVLNILENTREFKYDIDRYSMTLYCLINRLNGNSLPKILRYSFRWRTYSWKSISLIFHCYIRWILLIQYIIWKNTWRNSSYIIGILKITSSFKR